MRHYCGTEGVTHRQVLVQRMDDARPHCIILESVVVMTYENGCTIGH
jgi:hypothetical protein